MNKFKTVLFVVSILLVLTFTFSCSSSGDNDGGGGSGINRGSDKGNDIANYKPPVQIGDQVWMAENLNYKVDGSKCGGNDHKLYDENTINCDKFGRLYNWATAMGIDAKYNRQMWNGSDVKHRGICPSGWHLPSNNEWQMLIDFVGGVETAGTKLKATSDWNSYSGVPFGTDTYGFSAMPGGYGYSDGGFYDVGNYGDWWGASEAGSYNAYYLIKSYYHEGAEYSNFDKDEYFSVRCLQD
ncbi:MAG: fibrobacter succinogenes major paralogous domain-containing protein [Fibromonadaceae bacterium]|jgi:uncharacterized protein (TIGR02145 family)|nr:fibrobacter succinogenes major paralogous domain-containing protein [Fibromonadaceae bacterium]